MPLLRLTSLIVASLLLAALSALAPTAGNRHFSVSDQAPAHAVATALAMQSASAPAPALPGAAFSSMRQREAGLDQITGQSIPRTGQ